MRATFLGVSMLSLAWMIASPAAVSAPQAAPQAAPQTATKAAPAQVPAANPWAVHDAKQSVAIKHAAYARLLESIVVDDGKATQVAFAVMNDPARQLLDQYITWLAGLPVSQLNRTEQLAYWLNLHNALTIKEIEAAGGKGPVDRFRQFPIASTGPFAKPVVEVEGVPLSITDIEQDVLRANFSDFPYQYGVFLAAKGAPDLRREAYSGARISEQLEDQAKRFINNGGVRAKGNGLELSSFYDWWGADIPGNHANVREHLAHYAEPKLARKISAASDSYTYRFDWTIPAFQLRQASLSESGGLGGSGGFIRGGSTNTGASPGGGS